MFETPTGDVPAMATIIPGTSPGEFKTGRRLQSIFDQQAEMGVQRTLPGSIIQVGDLPRQRQTAVLPIQDVDPGTVLLNFDIGQDEAAPSDIGQSAEHQQQSELERNIQHFQPSDELERSLQQFLQVDTTDLPSASAVRSPVQRVPASFVADLYAQVVPTTVHLVRYNHAVAVHGTIGPIAQLPQLAKTSPSQTGIKN